MSEKYSQMVILVHPLYDLRSKLGERKISKNGFKQQYKKSLAEYGKVLLNYKNAPKTLFVMVIPATRKEFYNEHLERFEKFAKKVLGDRFVKTDFAPYGSQLKFLPQNMYTKLNSEINILTYGEYAERCVKIWGEGYIPSNLKSHNIEVASVKILEESSVYASSKTKGISDRFLFTHKRRQELARKKKQKKRNLRKP